MEQLAICAIFKNEAPYLLEWIAYHKTVGFDHFVLYDHDSTDGGADIVRNSIFSDDVTILRWTPRPGQLQAYNHFAENYAREFDWVAFIDMDEFIHPLDHKTIRPSMERYADFSTVLFNWLVFGPSNHKTRPSGLVIDAYRHRFPDAWQINNHVKSFVRTAKLRGSGPTPHTFQVDGPSCDALGREIYPVPILPTAVHQGVVVNHYYTKSFADWTAKLRRGKADTPDDPDKQYQQDLFFQIERDAAERDDRMAVYSAEVEFLVRCAK